MPLPPDVFSILKIRAIGKWQDIGTNTSFPHQHRHSTFVLLFISLLVLERAEATLIKTSQILLPGLLH